MPKIFVTRPILPKGLDDLRQAGFELDVWEAAEFPTQADLLARAKTADGILCMLDDRIDAAFIGQNPHLRVISNYAVGFNNIDVATATALGIPVGNTPGVLTEATADIAFALLLAVARKILDSHLDVRAGRWRDWHPTGYLGLDLVGKTLGIVGMGRIGQAMAKRCFGAYDMDVLYTANSPKPEAEQAWGARRVSLPELLAQSDVVSVHCSLGPDTAGMFDLAAFRQMKPTAVFINTARGGIHHEADLATALREGRLWGAGLDVTNPEPMLPDSPLLGLPNVVVTPHIGSATFGTRAEMSAIAAQNIIRAFRREPLVGFVNPGVFGQ
jgi:glyoxylate reductase